MQAFLSRCNQMLTRCVSFFYLVSNTPEMRLYYLWPVHTTHPSAPYAYQHSSIRDISTTNEICNVVALFKQKDPSVISQEKEEVFKEMTKRTLEGYSKCLMINRYYKGWDGNIGDYGFLLMLGISCGRTFPESVPQGWEEMEMGFVDAICGQQRKDGSVKIFFDKRKDGGEAFYLPEAMIGLCTILESFPRWMTPERQRKMENCITNAFKFVGTEKFRKSELQSDTVIFYCNWQFKWGLAWLKYLTKVSRTDEFLGVYEHLMNVLEGLKLTRFVGQSFEKKATVEVGCYCEGLVSLMHTKIILKENDDEDWITKQIQKSIDFLEKVQESTLKGWSGGFVHSLGSKEARLDVTGHIANALSEIITVQK